jgi:transposase
MDWREGRRLQGWKLLQAGWRQVEVAEAVGVTKGAVSQWVKRAHEGGIDALRRHPAPGAKSKLTPAQLAALPNLLAGGAEAYGFRGQVWTHPRIAKVIQEKMGVHYHPNHLPRLLKKVQWTRQKPRRRASQRNEVAIQHWYRVEWPSLMKQAAACGQTVVFMDEAGFRLLPALVATYAPRGQTPILDVPFSRDHLSVMGAVTLEGKLLTWIQDHSVKGPDVVRFLKHVLAQIPGKILLIWDNLPAHRGQAVQAFLASEAARRLTLKALPSYAPDLNPEEGIWRFLKYVELKNVCCHRLTELHLEVRRAIERLRFKAEVILGCVRQPGYIVQLPKTLTLRMAA